MRYEIQTEHVRAHTLTQRAVHCPNALDWDRQTRYGVKARLGDWITYGETRTNSDGSNPSTHYRTGRVLGRIEAPALEGQYPSPAVDGWISVLALSDSLQHAYIRWVDPAEVTEISARPPAKLLAWMTGPLPAPDLVHKLSAYGTLSESYIDKADHHLNAWKHGVSPAAWDSGLRSPAAVEADRARPISAELAAKLGRGTP